MHKTSDLPSEVEEFEADSLSIMMMKRMDLPIDDVTRRHITKSYMAIDKEAYKIEESFIRIQKAYNMVMEGFEKELPAFSAGKEISQTAALNQNIRQSIAYA